jgi:serine/threonine protein kinase
MEVILVFELCSGKFLTDNILGGTLFNLIEQRNNMGVTDGVDELEILEIIGEIATGLLHLHLQSPPIAHRDLKVNEKNI